MKNNNIFIAAVLCLVVISIGITGFMMIEDYSFSEAFYMSVITISTVGFGEVKPLSEAGRLFTSFVILSGIGVLAFAGHAVVESLMEKVWSGNSEVKKMKKRIADLKGHYIVCGFGRVGESAVEYFSEAGVDFLLIEFSTEQCQQIKDRGYIFLEGDATRESTLLEAGIKSAGGLMALLDSDPKNLFVILTARELNPTLHIIARLKDKENDNKILRAGADSVISPYSTAGRHIANDMLVATGKTEQLSAELSAEESGYCLIPQWINVSSGSSMLGNNVEHVCKEMGREILGLRRGDKDFIKPDPAMVLENGDMLLVLDDAPEEETELLAAPLPVPKKIVIVDDNPVIVRLYSRLFQKAGFHPITAANGDEGLELICRERPVVAVVDYKLPGINGVDVCRKVRANDELDNIKFILFTADDDSKTRKMALKAGADDVVLKSPEASEVITAVVRLLEEK